MINIFKIGIFKKMLSGRLGSTLFEGKSKPGVIYVPYGMFANIKENIPAGVLLDQGNEESLLFLPFDIENRETLSKNEIGFGIPSEKNRIYFRNGKITFKIDETEGGDFAVRFNELKVAFDELKQDHNDLVTAYNAFLVHVHGAAGTPPVPPAIPESLSTADMADSKIDKIELPEL